MYFLWFIFIYIFATYTKAMKFYFNRTFIEILRHDKLWIYSSLWILIWITWIIIWYCTQITISTHFHCSRKYCFFHNLYPYMSIFTLFSFRIKIEYLMVFSLFYIVSSFATSVPFRYFLYLKLSSVHDYTIYSITNCSKSKCYNNP